MRAGVSLSLTPGDMVARPDRRSGSCAGEARPGDRLALPRGAAGAVYRDKAGYPRLPTRLMAAFRSSRRISPTRVCARSGSRAATTSCSAARTPILVEAKPNARWSIDFVQLSNGRRFRIINMTDGVMKEFWRQSRTLNLGPPRRARTRCRYRAARQAGPHDVRRTIGLLGISSRRASRCRTASARRSTAECAG
jgi:hypothetical protein